MCNTPLDHQMTQWNIYLPRQVTENVFLTSRDRIKMKYQNVKNNKMKLLVQSVCVESVEWKLRK